MAHSAEQLDFSGLFKLDVLSQLEVIAFSFYEVGLQKCLSLSSGKELLFMYISPQNERLEKYHDWDFKDNPVHCMCYEPSGTWLVVISDQKVLLVPFLPLFIPQNTFDFKWSLNAVTVLPLLSNNCTPTSVVWWLTKNSDNIIIIGTKTGTIIFYSLDSTTVIGETKVSDEISDLQICFDDSLDLLTLLITGVKSQQWKLVLEHRSYGYNWLQQSRSSQLERKDSFISYIKQLSKDKITLLTQGTSKDSKPQTVEYVLKPTEYLPAFRKGSNNWTLTAQYVNGRHFLTAFEVNEGTIILESPEQEVESRTLRPIIKKDGLYVQGLWSQRLIYLLRHNEIEVHSSIFSGIQGDGLLGSREHTLLWSSEIIGSVYRCYLMSTREPAQPTGGWKEPTFMCDLQLPRFNLEQCLVITTSGVYLLNTICSPVEWLVGGVVRGGVGAEQSAAALGAGLSEILRAAADLLLARGRHTPAHYLYSLSQSPAEGWLARLGVFGRIDDLSTYKQTSGADGGLTTAAILLKLLASIIKYAMEPSDNINMNVKLTNFTTQELEELSVVTSTIGLWELVPTFNIHRGHPNLFLSALKARNKLCRGAIDCLLKQHFIVTILLDENGQWLFDTLSDICCEFDTNILKSLCLWICPFREQFRPVMRDLQQNISTVYTSRMLSLITTFMRLVSTLESRQPNRDFNPHLAKNKTVWKIPFVPKRVLSCGLNHWTIVEDGNAKIVGANTPINTELIGRVMDIACGRHHTLVLTENGVYSSGDNRYGQLGVGTSWAGALDDTTAASGTLLQSEAPQDLVAVAAGDYHSAAIDTGGRLYMWGWGVHGQLGLGSIDDECTPKLVTKLQGRKVISVSCGSCHSVILTKCGSVYACGAGVFGQLGSGGREKSSLPARVNIPDPVRMVAAGYFHNLALTYRGEVWTWGLSPQGVRAANARRASGPSPDDSPPATDPLAAIVDPHLLPTKLQLHNVTGAVMQIAAGWHHSCIVDDNGVLYTWGLNFDGQLGSGDRKQIQVPTVVKIKKESALKTDDQSDRVPQRNKNRALAACGGDFTVFIDVDGKIYVTGHSRDSQETQTQEMASKLANRVIMMKTTKRVIKIPAHRNSNKFIFQHFGSIENMIPFNTKNMQRTDIEPIENPLKTKSDFERITWPDEIVLLLQPWIKEDSLEDNPNMTAKLAYRNEKYSDCLKLLLDNLIISRCVDKTYITHGVKKSDKHINKSEIDDKIVIKNSLLKRIKDISLSILNQETYPIVDVSFYKNMPCLCNEVQYLCDCVNEASVVNVQQIDLSLKAADIIDKCISIFPVNTDLWEICFRYSKDFYIDNNLSASCLETVLKKYMELNPTTMAAAIMYSSDCVQYSKILTPNFYLILCSDIINARG